MPGPVAPSHSVLLKHPGVPGELFRWQPAHTGAFDGSVFVCVDPVEERHGAFGCGARLWQE